MTPIDNPPPAAAGGWTRRVAANIEVLYPRLANNAVLTCGAAAWQWGAWVVLSASLPSAFLPNAVHLVHSAVPADVWLNPFGIETELGTGASGSEVSYGTFADAAMVAVNPLPLTLLVSFGHTLPVGPTPIPAGTRVVARVRKSVADATLRSTTGLYLSGHAVTAGDSDLTYPLDDHLEGSHTSISANVPQGAFLTPVLGAYPTYGPWLEAIASAPQDLLVHGTAAGMFFNLVGTGHHLQFGIGASGSEVPYALLGCPVGGLFQGSGIQTLRRPLLVLTGERLSIRIAGGGQSSQHQLLYEKV